MLLQVYNVGLVGSRTRSFRQFVSAVVRRSTEACSVKRKSVKKREVTRKQSKITRGKGLFLF